MRRVFLVVAIACLTSGLMAGPALASTRTHERYKNDAANAFWQSKTPLSSTSYELTTWYVGVYTSSHGTFSQLVKSVAKCHRASGRQRCREVSFAFGFLSHLTAKQFTFDAKRLDSAHLNATYLLHQYKPKKTFKVTIVADWTGTGKLSHNGGNDNYHSGCLRFHDTFKGRSRKASVTASENGTSLGTARQAFLSTNSYLTISHRCRS
jgi:hypothetical protein